jgi:ribosomal protein S18 acetylase RimI-like enzyme
LEERGQGVPCLTAEAGAVEVREVPPGQREPLLPIIDASFTGLYQRHARRTLVEVDTVMVAQQGETAAGLVMLKMLGKQTGYVYYIAVLPAFRGRGTGARLLLASLDHFQRLGATEVYATVGEDNVESNALFSGRGFRRTSLGEVSRKYGTLNALSMYRGMLVVPGEVVLVKDTATLTDSTPSPNP